MFCTPLTNMCTTCRETHQALMRQYPNHTIDPSPGIYPVAFRASFPEIEVPFDYGLKVADHLEEFLQVASTNKERIPVLAYSNFAANPRFESEVRVSVLIEFPDHDVDEIERLFEGLVSVMGGWEVLLPEGCANAFWLEWHRDPIEMP